MNGNAEISKLLTEPGRYWKFPFRYDDEGAVIWDANDNRVLDVRGNGMLTGSGAKAHGLTESAAAFVQDQLGCAVVNLLNDNWPKR